MTHSKEFYFAPKIKILNLSRNFLLRLLKIKKFSAYFMLFKRTGKIAIGLDNSNPSWRSEITTTTNTIRWTQVDMLHKTRARIQLLKFTLLAFWLGMSLSRCLFVYCLRNTVMQTLATIWTAVVLSKQPRSRAASTTDSTYMTSTWTCTNSYSIYFFSLLSF